MVTGGPRSQRLLIVNSGARAVTGEVRARFAQEFPDFQVVEFPPADDFLQQLSDHATIVACGGDGTVEAVARALAGTGHNLGIVPLGTFNNFARALKLPTDFESAIQVIETGRPRPVTLGMANEHAFLEAAAVGVFGDVIAFGEAAKDLHYGDALSKLKSLVLESDFAYTISGDVQLAGRAPTIIVANTPSIGALLPVADTTPEQPTLELIVGRDRFHIRRVRIETEPPVSAYADASAIGKAPVDVRTLPGGLHVILPA